MSPTIDVTNAILYAEEYCIPERTLPNTCNPPVKVTIILEKIPNIAIWPFSVFSTLSLNSVLLF